MFDFRERIYLVSFLHSEVGHSTKKEHFCSFWAGIPLVDGFYLFVQGVGSISILVIVQEDEEVFTCSYCVRIEEKDLMNVNVLEIICNYLVHNQQKRIDNLKLR